MPLAESVYLPRDVAPEFPDRCCACLRPRPGDYLRLSHRRGSVLDLLLPWIFAMRRRVCHEVPICPDCRGVAQWYPRILGLGMFVALVLTTILVYPWVTSLDLHRRWHELVAVGIGVASMLPIVVVQVLFPSAAELTVRAHDVEFEFRNARYAELFAAENPAARRG